MVVKLHQPVFHPLFVASVLDIIFTVSVLEKDAFQVFDFFS
jgi:hypothetical protein